MFFETSLSERKRLSVLGAQLRSCRLDALEFDWTLRERQSHRSPLRAGIPQTPKLSPMPQFSALSDSEIADIVRWVHYTRQQGHYKEVIEVKQMTGDAASGKAYFDQKCASCHFMETDFSEVGKKYDPSTLKAQIFDRNS